MKRRVLILAMLLAGSDVASGQGTAQLVGTVRDHQGAPVAGARVTISVAGGFVTTTDSGRFAFDSLREGVGVLQVRRLGYSPVSMRVGLVRDSTTTVAIQFTDQVAVLSQVSVRARRYDANMAEFERRRRQGFGHYMGPEDLARRAPNRLPFIISMVPGANLVCPRGGTDCTIRFNRQGATCSPSIYIDGRLDQTGMAWSIFSDQLSAVEVYSRSATRPQEFQDLNQCGAIAVWRLPPELDTRESADVAARKECGGRLNWCYSRKWLPFVALVGLGFGVAVSF